jgi:uncharacterized protein involved in type VI secretion and phage assembly
MSFAIAASVALDLPAVDTDCDLPTYELAVFPFPRSFFWVHELVGEEALSQPFHFEIVVTTETTLDGVLERALVGQRATLVMKVGPVARVIQGLVGSITVVNRHPANDRTIYRMRLVPRLWLLQFQRRSRIFQHMTVAQVVTHVLAEANIRCRWLLSRDPPIREYCTQYEETDLDFVHRLLAEAGIFYFFSSPSAAVQSLLASLGSPPGGVLGDALSIASGAVLDALFGSETLVLSDDALGYSPIDDGSVLGDVAELIGAPTQLGADLGIASVKVGLPAPQLHYMNALGTNTPAHDKIVRFDVERQVCTTSATYREYDPARPGALLMNTARPRNALASGLEGAVEGELALGPDGVSAEVSVDPTSALLVAALQSLNGLPSLEYYDHHGPFLFPDWKYGGQEPERIVRQLSRERHRAKGDSLVPVLHAGHRFKLEDHPLDHLNKEYALTRVRHRGRATSSADAPVYLNDFECVPATTPFCPSRPARRSVMVVLTATVVGPSGEDVYTDELGQIRAHFHWDREGAPDERSSCWLRTMQPWAGAGWGSQFIPRVGMEVVVTFEGGDPDKPICLGCVNNGTHHPAFPLPANRTRSGLRTSSTPDAQGYNELSFEDAAGREQVFLRAERDFDSQIRRNQTIHVGADKHTRVDGNADQCVTQNSKLHVGGKCESMVVGDCKSTVEGNRVETTSGNLDHRVAGTSVTRLDGKEFREVRGNALFQYADDLTLRVNGCETVVVGRHEAERTYNLHVEGVARIHGTKALELSTDKELVLRCGKSVLRIGKDKIEIEGAALAMKGGGSGLSISESGLQLSSKSARAQLGDNKILVVTDDGASVCMGQEVKIDGKKILLNAPDRAQDPPPEEPPKLTDIAVKDQKGNPLAHQRYLVVLDDGSEHSGFTDKDGKVSVDLPADGAIFFPELNLVSKGS